MNKNTMTNTLKWLGTFTLIVGVGFIWSTRASSVFMVQVIKEERKVLAVFPVFFFYTFIGWMVLLQ